MPVAWDSLVPKSVVDFHIYPDFLMRAAMTRVEGGCRHRNKRCSKSPLSPGSVFAPSAGTRLEILYSRFYILVVSAFTFPS